jgi:hypothetical protein
MRTSFHHQPEAQHPNFQLSTSWQADYPILRLAIPRQSFAQGRQIAYAGEYPPRDPPQCRRRLP